ncbi:MAG: ABC transporter ATP-binding protein [Pseudobdellovibrionaceae bacterium]
MSDIILEVKNLKTSFKTDAGLVTPVDDISFTVRKGQTLGIVGESGCGKSVTSLSVMGLIQKPGFISGGEVLFKGKDLVTMPEDQKRHIRGKEMSMIFQEPMTSLNPVFTVGDQIAEALAIHQKNLNSQQRKDKTIELLKKVGIPAPEKRFAEYPHQLSGGMRQRIMIAMAISCNPELLIADEPTTALDVTIQAQILDLMRQLQQDYGAGMILITHDLGVVAELCKEVIVMYAGKIVEYGTVEDIFYRPRHPYTRGLLDSIPHFETGQKLTQLKTIPGLVPSLTSLPQGCRFQDRCFKAQPQCTTAQPALENLRARHKVACFYPLSAEASE